MNSGLVTAGLAEFKSRLSPEGREECGAEGVRQRNVKFQWTGANDVSIAGSFTDWKEVKLKRRYHYSVCWLQYLLLVNHNI